MATKPAKRSPAFQFYPSDFLGSPKVAVMDVAEIGAYLLLLCLDWEEGGFTLDEAREFVVRRGRLTAEQFDAMWSKLARCFESDSGRFFNARLRAERKKQKAWSRKSSKGGKLGMQKRWGDRDKGGYTVVTPNDNIPSPTPSPTPKRKQRGEKKADWLLPLCVVWEKHKGAGTFPWGKAGGACKSLHRAGHSGDKIAANLDRYLTRTEPRYHSLARFAENFADFDAVKLTGPAVVDGWLSDEVDRLTRPPGLVA